MRPVRFEACRANLPSQNSRPSALGASRVDRVIGLSSAVEIGDGQSCPSWMANLDTIFAIPQSRTSGLQEKVNFAKRRILRGSLGDESKTPAAPAIDTRCCILHCFRNRTGADSQTSLVVALSRCPAGQATSSGRKPRTPTRSRA